MSNNGEFKGKTKATLANVKEDIKELRKQIKSVDRRVTIILIIGAALLAEKLPQIIRVALAFL